MIGNRNGNRRAVAGLRRRATSSSGTGYTSGTSLARVERAIVDACHGFVVAADWQAAENVAVRREDGGVERPAGGCRLSENHEGLHSGMYINVTLMEAANALAIRGGCYDRYCQPRTLYQESLPLKEVTAQALGCLLMEMHDRLCHGDRAQVTKV